MAIAKILWAKFKNGTDAIVRKYADGSVHALDLSREYKVSEIDEDGYIACYPDEQKSHNLLLIHLDTWRAGL